jgi:hypothetical protein
MIFADLVYFTNEEVNFRKGRMKIVSILFILRLKGLDFTPILLPLLPLAFCHFLFSPLPSAPMAYRQKGSPREISPENLLL